MEWEWYKDSNTKDVFIHLLLSANFKESAFKGFPIKPGQVVIGRKKLAEALGLSERAVRTALNHLKSTNEVAIQTTNRFSIVTIVNWEFYQVGDEQVATKTATKTANKGPASGHTIRNKESKNKRIGGSTPKSQTKKQELEDFYAMTEEWANEQT